MAQHSPQNQFAVKSLVGSIFRSKDLIVVFFIMAILAIIIVPLPAPLLDFFLTISIALSVLIILIGLYIAKPTDFSAFPTLLLMVTLFRLALNVATTRMILSNGHLGAENVSEIISAFGNFVVGGNYVIGIIVFSILVIVNYLVITNGATRVAEVQARFMLEAMPGKQMAIDADLNSGLIEKDEAQRRREALTQEADFYGSMDGASKFVKGDAIAGIIITFVNIIGGFLIGFFMRGMGLAESAATFTILTIGDGLVSQIPALIVSTATGIVITRATKSDEQSFPKRVVNQLLGNSKILAIVGTILVFFALIPGLPTLSLGFVGFVFLLMSYLLSYGSDKIFAILPLKKSPQTAPIIKQKPLEAKNEVLSKSDMEAKERWINQQHEDMIDNRLRQNVLLLNVGLELVKIANSPESPLMEKIRAIRVNFASQYGFVIPKISISSLYPDLPSNTYEFFLKGVKIGGGQVEVNKFLVLNPTGEEISGLDGIPTKDPVSNGDALWVDGVDSKDEALTRGYIAVDSATVISTHISELIRQYAEEILTREDVKNLINKLQNDFPNLVSDTQTIPLGVIHKVLRDLLHDGIPIKDMITILETIIDVAPKVQNNTTIIIDYVRAALSRVITNLFKSDDGAVKFFNLPAESESYLLQKMQDNQYGRHFILSIAEMQKVIDAFISIVNKAQELQITPILLCETNLRSPLSKLAEKNNVPLKVLGNAEISTNAKIEFLGNIELKFN
ncbi:flagellar biosynthesis protein FlhA [Helicobacter sp. 23-1045]